MQLAEVLIKPILTEKANAQQEKLKRYAFKALQVNGKKTLFVVDEFNDNLFLSLRNISKVESSVLADMNTYDIVNADVLVLTENAAKIFTEDSQEVEA